MYLVFLKNQYCHIGSNYILTSEGKVSYEGKEPILVSLNRIPLCLNIKDYEPWNFGLILIIGGY